MLHDDDESEDGSEFDIIRNSRLKHRWNLNQYSVCRRTIMAVSYTLYSFIYMIRKLTIGNGIIRSIIFRKIYYINAVNRINMGMVLV